MPDVVEFGKKNFASRLFSFFSGMLLIEFVCIIIIGYGAGRIVVGLVCIAVSFLLFETLFKIIDMVLEKVLGIATRVVNGKQHIPILDLSYKYLSFCITAFHVTFSIPRLFTYLKIENHSYYDE